MGNYTELDLACELRKDTPPEILDDLEKMAQCRLPFDHPFAKAVQSAGSYYFEGKALRSFWYNSTTEAYHFQVKTNCKNYNGEIHQFIDWLKPHLSDSGEEAFSVIGYIRYEDQIAPDLIMDNGDIWHTVVCPSKQAAFKVSH